MALLSEKLTEEIIGAAIAVHKAMGPGLLESVYEVCLAHELIKRDLRAERQVEVPVKYDSVTLDCGFRIDLLVNDEVVIELKAVEKLQPIHEAQLMTYLRLSGKRVGLIINFNSLRFRDGIIRRVL
jgi:GxxExxY protein